MKARKSKTQRQIARFALYHWVLWSVTWYVLGWRAGGPGGLFVGWAASTALPYRTWLRWETRAVVKSSLKRMGMLQ